MKTGNEGGRDRPVCRLTSPMGKKRDKRGPDAAVARIATNQHGVITTSQLLGAGLNPSGITKRLHAGRLHRVHRRVYAVGHEYLSNEGRWMAGVLACGAGAVLSHTSAGELWRIHPRAHRLSEARNRGEVADVHVTLPSTAGIRKRDGNRAPSVLHPHCTPLHPARRDPGHDASPHVGGPPPTSLPSRFRRRRQGGRVPPPLDR
jgi:hypothetical protein